jgi:hypothetical protein
MRILAFCAATQHIIVNLQQAQHEVNLQPFKVNKRKEGMDGLSSGASAFLDEAAAAVDDGAGRDRSAA